MPATFSLPHLLVFSTLLCLVSSSSSLPPLLPSSHLSLHSPPISALASLVSSCPALVTLSLSSVIGHRPSFLRVQPTNLLCIRFFNEMEDTNESTNLRKLADVWMSKNRCCQGHRNRSAVSVTRITVDIGHPSQEEEEVNTHRFRSQICRKMSVFTKLHGHKTIEVEFRIRVERPLLPRSR